VGCTIVVLGIFEILPERQAGHLGGWHGWLGGSQVGGMDGGWCMTAMTDSWQHGARRQAAAVSRIFDIFTASRVLIPHPCSGFGRGTRATQVIPGQGTRGATRGVGMGYASYPRPTLPGYSDYMEWGTCCTWAMNGHLHGLCTTCTLPHTQFGYATYPAAGLRLGTRAMHNTYTVCVHLSLDLVFF